MDMRLKSLIKPAIALAAMLAVMPAYSQIYKWVDERGVTNYSGQPPIDPKAAEKVAVVENKVSVYTPDPALLRAVEASRERVNRAPYYRAESVEVQRPQVIVINNLIPPSAYESDLAYYPVWAGPARHSIRQPQLVQAALPPGAIAGNVVGMAGYIPGNSAAAAAQREPIPATRASRTSPLARGSWRSDR
jgi:hypothetical protein